MLYNMSFFYYIKGTPDGINHWDFQGTTIVKNNRIRLTTDSSSENGALWNNYVNIT
jgi:hypothetical protein